MMAKSWYFQKGQIKQVEDGYNILKTDFEMNKIIYAQLSYLQPQRCSFKAKMDLNNTYIVDILYNEKS